MLVNQSIDTGLSLIRKKGKGVANLRDGRSTHITLHSLFDKVLCDMAGQHVL